MEPNFRVLVTSGEGVLAGKFCILVGVEFQFPTYSSLLPDCQFRLAEKFLWNQLQVWVLSDLSQCGFCELWRFFIDILHFLKLFYFFVLPAFVWLFSFRVSRACGFLMGQHRIPSFFFWKPTSEFWNPPFLGETHLSTCKNALQSFKV